MRKPIQPAKIKTDWVQFYGGIDTEASQLNASPGTFKACVNYEPLSLGGVKRIDGYERFDGRLSPHNATFLYLEIVKTGAISVNDTITGVSSGAHGTVLSVGALDNGNYYATLVAVIGTFVASESIAVGTIAKDPIPNGGFSTPLDNATAMLAAQNYYRSFITAVPGVGPILGISMLNGVMYAFRNAVGGLSVGLYKSTSSGWSSVPLYSQISFTAGNAAIADGTTITQLTSGATGIVRRQVLETSTYLSGTATGRLIISVTSGTFDNTHAIQVGGVTKCTASSAATQIVILPNGKYEMLAYNFTGSTDTRRIYGCDGVNPAFEFDGTVYCPIRTGMPTDTPSHITAHQGMLFLSYGGSSENSGKGLPLQWTATVGALENGLGDIVTGYARVTGKVLLQFTMHQVYQLSGTSVLDFASDLVTANIGAKPYSIQHSSTPYFMSSLGIINVTNTQNYGNFESDTVSRKIQKIIDRVNGLVVASSVYKSRNQIRWYFNDGSGLICTVSVNKDGALDHQYSEFKYPTIVTCAYSGQDSVDGKSVFFGDTSGYVYQADVGSSFDGAAIEAFFLTHYTSSKSPNIIKQYRKAWVEIANTSYAQLKLYPDFAFGDYKISQHFIDTYTIDPIGGRYDIDAWDTIYYDAKLNNRQTVDLHSSAINVAFSAYSNTALDTGHTITSIGFTYTPRRIES